MCVEHDLRLCEARPPFGFLVGFFNKKNTEKCICVKHDLRLCEARSPSPFFP
jgi:hypothetical protein